MNLMESINNFVGVFSFTEEEKRTIKEDLIKIIYSKFLIELNESGNDKYLSQLKTSMDLRDFDKMQTTLEEIFQDQKLSEKFDKISKDTVEDWLNNIAPSLNQEDKAKAEEILKDLQTA